MVSQSKTKKINQNLPNTFWRQPPITEKGSFTIEQKKKKREIFQEQGHQTNVPPDVSDERKKALAQKGDDAVASW
jgi:hypothetical protein